MPINGRVYFVIFEGTIESNIEFNLVVTVFSACKCSDI